MSNIIKMRNVGPKSRKSGGPQGLRPKDGGPKGTPEPNVVPRAD